MKFDLLSDHSNTLKTDIYSYCYLSLVQDFRTDLWEFLDSQTFGSPVDSAETLFPSSSESCGVDPLTADYWDRKLGLEC